ncbi:gamma-butyrobetaine dioxygenase-like [Acanthaster planci]|uniref:Gamma-butyrobetaine dioxygenase-like n=1 Tax=Acanthaster planci TaxID=133434 RepID=A0A8B7XRY2_ACAPL|nr:gamma-butyrobetaine dioxygenase-like [Acanthaster planci]XP_022082951.1 gamma-butyrobetaine dioxygenase-like [Acanthaster planci]XP_022082952.1 gamma-butyrobetaine dioxygenase-like [Acanthaster planci]
MEENPRLKSVTRDEAARWYRVAMDSGYEGTYPYVWLRDNCRCFKCSNPSIVQRTFKMADLDPEVQPESETIVDDGKVLRIIWPNQHSSDFDAAWLNSQRFSGNERDTVARPIRQSWGAELNGKIPTFDFQKLLQDDRELYNWLHVLNTKGLAVVNGAPTKEGSMRQLADRIAYLKPTLYGDLWQVQSRPNPSRVVYTPGALPLHTDQVYLTIMPGIQMLHCIQRTNVDGAENQFVDGLRAVEQVKNESPKAYELLTTRELDYETNGCDRFKAFHVKNTAPTILLDRHGEFHTLFYDNCFRAASMSRVPVGEVTEMYRALRLLHDVMYRPENLVHYELAEGEIATFDNLRVMHARSAFTITGGGGRTLEGGYFDWDEARSRMRVLQKSLSL